MLFRSRVHVMVVRILHLQFRAQQHGGVGIGIERDRPLARILRGVERAQAPLAAGEVVPVSGGRIYARSHPKDTARTEERTFVATADPADQGAYNNWRLSSEIKPRVMELMRNAAAGKTIYAIPYLMAPPGSPLDSWAAGLELTDSRVVALHMIRMTRVGPAYLDNLVDPDSFVRGVHVTGDLDNLGQGTPEDMRHFITVADERLILHFGSSYGGDRKSTRLNSSHIPLSRMPSSA